MTLLKKMIHRQITRKTHRSSWLCRIYFLSHAFLFSLFFRYGMCCCYSEFWTVSKFHWISINSWNLYRNLRPLIKSNTRNICQRGFFSYEKRLHLQKKSLPKNDVVMLKSCKRLIKINWRQSNTTDFVAQREW